jgi:hypothetical protein
VRVIVPHTRIEPETRAALAASGYGWEAVSVAGSDTAYTDLLADLWAAGQDFAIVEHDIVPWRGALAELDSCTEQWCAFPYPLRSWMHAGLGCARFRGTLLAACPTAVTDTLAEQTGTHPRGHWCNLDDRLSRSLRRLGAARHVHPVPVGHLFPEPSHGCT